MLLTFKKCEECLCCRKRVMTSTHHRQVGRRVYRQETAEFICLHPKPPKDGPIPDSIPEDCPILREGTILKSSR